MSIRTSWIMSARCLISSGVRTFLIMSILTSGMVDDYRQRCWRVSGEQGAMRLLVVILLFVASGLLMCW